MYKALVWCCLTALTLPAMATMEEQGSQYRNWCARSTDAEKIAADEREEHIRECIDTLVEADRKPEPSARKRKGGEEDDG